jgi:hypothetical protein
MPQNRTQEAPKNVTWQGGAKQNVTLQGQGGSPESRSVIHQVVRADVDELKQNVTLQGGRGTPPREREHELHSFGLPA